MSKEKDTAKGKKSKLVLILYIAAALMGVMFIYMLITSTMYINNYTASYGMSVGDMWSDAMQYILTSSVNYLVFALVLVGIGRILDRVERDVKGAVVLEAPEEVVEAAEENTETAEEEEKVSEVEEAEEATETDKAEEEKKDDEK